MGCGASASKSQPAAESSGAAGGAQPPPTAAPTDAASKSDPKPEAQKGGAQPPPAAAPTDAASKADPTPEAQASGTQPPAAAASIDAASKIDPKLETQASGTKPLKFDRTVSGFASEAGASGLMDGVPISDTFSGGLALLIIDPQNDFHEGGSLAVTGAVEDSARIAAILEKHADIIERVVVSLDTHHSMHIHNGNFWEDANGARPQPFTIITQGDIESGTWKARQPEFQSWALEYAKQLEAGGRFKLCIWPAHCILGTPGHAVHPPLMKALSGWAVKRKRTINWYFKGQNNRTEMYSALKAEVEIATDYTTSLDKDLVEVLTRHEHILCCGEALSHCVNYSVRDLLSAWPAGRNADIVVLQDCASAVTGFENEANQFLADMGEAGVTVCKSTDFAPRVDMKTRVDLQAERHFQTAFSSKAGSAGLMDGDPTKDEFKGGHALFIIDPQIDFHEGGSLAVPGAVEDSRRIAKVLEDFGGVIERVVVTLDTHHDMHIHNSNFWEDGDGKSPDPFTIITEEDVRAGKWKARDAEYQDWALKYAHSLEAGGRFKICIWPAHCLLGTPGHAVHPPLMEALDAWAIKRKRTINWYFKGQNNRAEMYSALKAEVEVPGDATTKIDTELVSYLAKHDRVLCCGEALSHCVNYSVRDLLSGWEKPADRIVVLEDAASPVTGFEESATTFLADMKAAGVTVCKTSDLSSLLNK